MAEDPYTSFCSFCIERAHQLRQRALNQITRTQWLVGAAGETRAHAASLRAECAMVLDEVCFRQRTLY